MAFTMSYGVAPPAVRTETPSKAPAPKKPASTRGRKHSTLQSQAQALFDPAQARNSEAPSEENATTESASTPSPA